MPGARLMPPGSGVCPGGPGVCPGGPGVCPGGSGVRPGGSADAPVLKLISFVATILYHMGHCATCWRGDLQGVHMTYGSEFLLQHVPEMYGQPS